MQLKNIRCIYPTCDSPRWSPTGLCWVHAATNPTTIDGICHWYKYRNHFSKDCPTCLYMLEPEKKECTPIQPIK